MTLAVAPRYFVYDGAKDTIALRGDVSVFREFTNSESTTQRGEWSFTDLALFPQYTRRVHESQEAGTILVLRLPTVLLPTSKASSRNGTLFGLGTTFALLQSLPLAGSQASALQSVTITASAGYQHTFTRAVVPTNPDLQRLRMNAEGQSIPSDQLGGVPFAKHRASFSIDAEVALTPRVFWTTLFSLQPAWSYRVADDDGCIQIQTGCVTPDRLAQSTNYTAATLFATELTVRALDEMSVAVGYNNLAAQLGPSGTRRSVLYSPDARFYLTIVAHLDEMYLSASGRRPSARLRRDDARSRTQ
jgi:hypothetical protein